MRSSLAVIVLSCIVCLTLQLGAGPAATRPTTQGLRSKLTALQAGHQKRYPELENPFYAGRLICDEAFLASRYGQVREEIDHEAWTSFADDCQEPVQNASEDEQRVIARFCLKLFYEQNLRCSNE